jgi:PAS domain S-box-containing protein
MSSRDQAVDDILVVDDEPANLKLLEQVLSEAGYRVRLTTEGKDALRSAKIRPPALFLLDIRMPGMDGYELCKHLKAGQATSSIPVIFLSALEDEHDKRKAFEAGGVDYITKPIHGSEVLARIGVHLGLRHAQIELKGRNAELEAIRDSLEERVKERSADLEHLNRELAAIRDCNQAIVRAEDEQTLLGNICDIICDKAGYRMAWAGYADNDEAKTVRPVAFAGADEGYLAQAGITWADTERGRGPAGTAIRSGKCACIQDFALDPEAAPWREEALRRGYHSVVAMPLKDRNGVAFGVLCIYSSKPETFNEGEVRLLGGLAGDLAFGIGVLRARAALRESEQKYRRLVDANIIGIIIWNFEGEIIEANDAFLNIVGYEREDLTSGRLRWTDLTPPEWLERDVEQMIPELHAAGILQPFEKEYFRKDGRRVPVLIGVARFEGSGNEGVAFILDLTESKKDKERLQAMVDELNHRVKNTLATVKALSAQTFRTAESPETFREAFEGRLLALSETHNLLNRSCWTGASLRDILMQELAPHAESGRFLLDGEDIRLGPVAAVTLGMAFHELAANAAKYGALSVAGGQVRVAWRPGAPGRLQLDWQECGGPPVSPPRRRGFGSRLIEETLAAEVYGEVRLDFLAQGVRCTMDLALERISLH